MAIGREPSETGGVISPADVRGAGTIQWADMTGIHPDHPLVSDGGAMGPYAIRSGGSRIATLPQAGPAGGTIATPDGTGGGPAARHLDDWRDLFNLKGSPAPWLLLLAIAALVFAHASVQARAGAFGRSLSTRAALE